VSLLVLLLKERAKWVESVGRRCRALGADLERPKSAGWRYAYAYGATSYAMGRDDSRIALWTVLLSIGPPHSRPCQRPSLS
jgi:hypothetical protein